MARNSSWSSAIAVAETVTAVCPTAIVASAAGASIRDHRARLSTSAIRPSPFSKAIDGSSARAIGLVDTTRSIERWSTLCSPSDGSTWRM